MMPVWERLLFNMADLVVYGPRVEILAIVNAKVVCSWFHFTPHTAQALAIQGGTQCYGTWKDGVFTATSVCLIILRALFMGNPP